MKKFILGLLIGCLVAYFSFGKFDDTETKADDVGAFSEEQSEAMKLAWYEYHHKTLSDALVGDCK